MATVRLDRSRRDAILRDALADRFDPDSVALDARQSALIKEIVAANTDPKELAKATELGTKWIATQSYIDVNADGYRIQLRGQPGDFIPQHIRYGIVVRDDLAARVKKYADDKEDFKTRRLTTSKALETLLSSVTTMKRLSEVWPEGQPYWSKYTVAPAPKLPALQVETINAMLGLPKDKAE